MAVESRPIPKKRGPIDWSLRAGNIAVWLVVASVGLLFLAVNGGFSVVGLGYIARQLNQTGEIAWGLLTLITFSLPINIPNLPVAQPFIPWLFVLGSSILQIVIIWRKLRELDTPPIILVFGIITSLYDYMTTFFGFGTLEWVKQAGVFIQILLAALFTFGLEITVALLLPRKD